MKPAQVNKVDWALSAQLQDRPYSNGRKLLYHEASYSYRN